LPRAVADRASLSTRGVALQLALRRAAHGMVAAPLV
jgi:hypothetical protein